LVLARPQRGGPAALYLLFRKITTAVVPAKGPDPLFRRV